MVSRFDHCLMDLLYRWERGELPVDIPLVVSNHEDCRQLVERHGVEYVHLPVTRDTKPEAEARLFELVDDHAIDFVVLARYMQVLSDDACRRLAGRAINIHHSFLPASRAPSLPPGPRARGQADRGHRPLRHRRPGRGADHRAGRGPGRGTPAPAEEMVTLGRDVERIVLARAVRRPCRGPRLPVRERAPWSSPTARVTGRRRALTHGTLSTARATAIVSALDALPTAVDPTVLAKAEAHLVAAASQHTPKQLRILGRRILEVVAPDAFDDHERRLLQAEEARARRRTFLLLRPNHDGTTDLRGRLPDPVADRLTTYLEAFTSPRQPAHHDTHDQPATGPPPPARPPRASGAGPTPNDSARRSPRSWNDSRPSSASTYLMVTIDAAPARGPRRRPLGSLA